MTQNSSDNLPSYLPDKVNAGVACRIRDGHGLLRGLVPPRPRWGCSHREVAQGKSQGEWEGNRQPTAGFMHDSVGALRSTYSMRLRLRFSSRQPSQLRHCPLEVDDVNTKQPVIKNRYFVAKDSGDESRFGARLAEVERIRQM